MCNRIVSLLLNTALKLNVLFCIAKDSGNELAIACVASLTVMAACVSSCRIPKKTKRRSEWMKRYLMSRQSHRARAAIFREVQNKWRWHWLSHSRTLHATSFLCSSLLLRVVFCYSPALSFQYIYLQRLPSFSVVCIFSTFLLSLIHI